MSALPLTMIEYQNLERAKILMPTSANRDEEWWERGEGGQKILQLLQKILQILQLATIFAKLFLWDDIDSACIVGCQLFFLLLFGTQEGD